MPNINFFLKLNTCDDKICYSGDIVTGTITTMFVKKQNIKYLKCKVIGVCKAGWTRPMPTTPYIRFYSHDEVLLDIDLNIFDQYSHKLVEPGTKTHNFCFVLPEGLPSSFQGSLGKVEYCILIHCRTSCKYKEKKYFFPITVYHKLNLNHLDEFVTPSYFETNFKTISGQLSLCVKTFTGFSQFQNIPMEIIILNEERIKLCKVVVSLVRKIRYNTLSGYADEERKICRNKFRLLTSDLKEICKFEMKIPMAIPSSTTSINQVLQISYFFKVAISFLYHLTHYENIPVKVSSVPVLHYDSEPIT